MKAVITFRIEDSDKEKIKDKARADGLDMASFCRHVVMQKINLEEKQNG